MCSFVYVHKETEIEMCERDVGKNGNKYGRMLITKLSEG